MEDVYDVIVLGTGLKESMLSGLLSLDGLKVLHLERGEYYGGSCASLNLNELVAQFKGGGTPSATLGLSREYSVDLSPMFVMADGVLVRMLLHTDAGRFLEFVSVAGSYIYRGGGIHKVPATDVEALESPMMNPLEKGRCKRFFKYIQEYEENVPATHDGADLARMPMSTLFAKFSLEPGTVDFVGHALALYPDDSYMSKPAIETIRKLKLYYRSLARYSTSPYLYSLYGVGELPQAFLRLSATHGGTIMLRATVGSVIYEAGKIAGIQSPQLPNTTARCECVVADPSYFPEKVRKIGQVVRAICLLSHPVRETRGADSAQIIIPQKEVGRQSDIYICVVSSVHHVCPRGRWIAIVSTSVETQQPVAELAPALALLNPIEEQFINITDSYVPLSDGTVDRVFITKSNDPSPYLESTVEEVLALYKRITGKDLIMAGDSETSTTTTQSGH
ncbi:Rab GDP dissociation inhibitor alpha [Pelomyxa schiedti]|nr:Rab GDP dissociation inhibitor alpha [Pelomyxa schiedti]